jgi:hypothetical protein
MGRLIGGLRNREGNCAVHNYKLCRVAAKIAARNLR